MAQTDALSDVPRNQLLAELDELSAVTASLDAARVRAGQATDETETTVRRHMFRFRLYMVLGIGIPALGIGIAPLVRGRVPAVVGYAIIVAALIVGYALVNVAFHRYGRARQAREELPRDRQVAEEYRDVAVRLERDYRIRLQRLPSDYRHPGPLNEIRGILLDNPTMTLGEAAEQYDTHRHQSIIDDWRYRQREQQRRKASLEQENADLRANDIVEAQRLVDQRHDDYAAVSAANERLRGIVQTHGEDPSII